MTRPAGVALLAVTSLAAAAAWADKRLDDAVTKAEQQLASKQPEDAEKTLSKLVPQGGAEAYAALAGVQLRLGKEDEAGRSLEQARALSATAPATTKSLVNAARAEHSLIAGAHQDALARAREAADAAPSARALAVLARAQSRAGDPAAVATAERAVAAGATLSIAHAAKGEALLAQGKASEAEAAFREAVRLDARSALARSGLALALSEQAKHTEALAEANKAVELEAHSADAQAVLALVLLHENPQQNWLKAIGHAQNATFDNPKSARAHVVVGELFEASVNELQADKAYEQALAIDAKLPPARLARVKRAMARDPKNAAAAAEACQLAADMPSSGEAQYLCALGKLAADDVVAAIPYLEKAVVLSPGLADAQYNLGRAYFLVNQAPRAIAHCQQAVVLAPKRLEFLTSCGLIIAKGGDTAAATTVLTDATRLDPKSVAAWTNLGWIYRSGRPVQASKAVEAYGKALAIDPQNVQAQLGLGWALVYAESWAEAETAFTKALSLDPKVAGDAYYGIARTWYFRRDMPKARAAAAKAEGAGRDVAGLRKNIADYEKAVRGKPPGTVKPPPIVDPTEEDQLVVFVHNLNHGSSAARRKACQDLGTLGTEAVPHLAGALTAQPDISVSQACLDVLCDMGKRAAGAIPTMEYVIATPPAVLPIGNDDEIKRELVYGDFIKKMKDCLRKLKN